MSDLLKQRAIDMLVEDLQMQLTLMKTKKRLLAEMRRPINDALLRGEEIAEQPALANKLRTVLSNLDHQESFLAQNQSVTRQVIAQYEALRTAEEPS